MSVTGNPWGDTVSLTHDVQGTLSAVIRLARIIRPDHEERWPELDETLQALDHAARCMAKLGGRVSFLYREWEMMGEADILIQRERQTRPHYPFPENDLGGES
jgi:hypothetical protein